MNVYRKLDGKEETLLPIVIDILKRHTCRDKAISNEEIRDITTQMGYEDIGQIRMRMIINHIRKNNLLQCVIGCNYGYYISTDEEEIKKYIEDLKDRELAISSTRETIENQLIMLLN